MKKLKKVRALLMILLLSIFFTACNEIQPLESLDKDIDKLQSEISNLPKYSDEAYAILGGNEPEFTDEDMTTKSFEYYSELDSEGRCGVVYANLGLDLMPTEERQSIGQVKPSGWKTIKYDNVDGKYLYNRCHLIGFQLSGDYQRRIQV